MHQTERERVLVKADHEDASRVAAALFVGFLLLVLGLPAGASAAGVCPNEALRGESNVNPATGKPYSTELPDCRAYEQVTPVDKNGVPVELGYRARASTSGDAITFFSTLPFPVPAAGASEFPTYLSSRAGDAWSTQGLLALTEPDGEASIAGWSEDLSEFVEGVSGADLPGAGENTAELYLRDSATGAYRRIADLGPRAAAHVDSVAPGGFVLFETTAQLLPEAVKGKSNVYEWDAESEQLGLVGVLPASEGGEAPTKGSIAGPYEWLDGETEEPGEPDGYYMQNVLSADGARVFWTATGTGRLYVGENGVSALVATAHFDAANAAGSELLADNGRELVEYAIAPGPTVTATPIAVAPSAGEIMGVLGMSEDGSYVYFAANAVLAKNEGVHGSHASSGDCVVRAPLAEATCNLYLWHDGQTIFIASLHTVSDWYDWTPAGKLGSGPAIPKSSRVSSGGRVLLFASNLDQTGYESRGHSELYRYEAPSEASPNGGLACVSCDPAGIPPRTAAEGESNEEAGQETTLFRSPAASLQPSSGPAFLPRNLSSDGSRVFFDSSEALLAQDEDEDGVRNVYEWVAKGSGSCEYSSASFSATSGGCLYLLSTGTSSEPSYFVDASLSGEDAFLDTSQPLVAQDSDELYDIYDARVDGGIAAQNERSTSSCEGEEECTPPYSSPPVSQAPASRAFSGVGNLTPPAARQEVKGAKQSVKPLTRAQKLAKALKACRKMKAKKQRRACESRARKQYAKKAVKSPAGSARRERGQGR